MMGRGNGVRFCKVLMEQKINEFIPLSNFTLDKIENNFKEIYMCGSD